MVDLNLQNVRQFKKCHRAQYNKLIAHLVTTDINELKIYGYSEYIDGRQWTNKHYKIWIDVGFKTRAVKIDNHLMPYLVHTDLNNLLAEKYKVRRVSIDELEVNTLKNLIALLEIIE